MAVSVSEVMRECNNFWEDGYIDATFTVTAQGKLSPADGIVDGQYIAICGSTYHDGVYQYSKGYLMANSNTVAETEGDVLPLTAETFTGRVWTLSVPAQFLSLCSEITTYADKTPITGLQSESFGNYSYTRATGAHGALTWQEAFSDRLRPYKRMFTDVRC